MITGKAWSWSGFPVATVVMTVVTAIGAAMQVTDPRVLEAFRRNQDALAAGEWWRWVTPLLVQSAGWGQILFNLGSLIVVGAVAERRLGTVRWLVLYVGAGLGGEVLGQWLDPGTAGNSLAVCGLVGAIVALLVVRSPLVGWTEIVVAPYYVACLTGLAFAGAAGAALASGMTLAVLLTLRRIAAQPEVVALSAGVVTVVAAAVLAVRPDQHGIAILAGAAMVLLMGSPGKTADPGVVMGDMAAYGRRKAALLGQVTGTVVEIGAGRGRNFGHFRRPLVWIGLEPDQRRHQALAAAAERHGHGGRILNATAEHIPLASGSIDTVISNVVLCSVGDPERVLAEVRRVLRPGGTFVFFEHVAAPAGTWIRWLQQVWAPWTRRFDSGCDPGRETWQAISNAGFASVDMRWYGRRIQVGVHGPYIAGQARTEPDSHPVRSGTPRLDPDVP